MSTDWKALCADLVKAVDNYDFDTESMVQDYSVLDRARAALAQPEPEGPTDEEIDALVICVQGLPVPDADDLPLPSIDRGREMVRQALARWGRPAITPIPVSELLEPEWVRQEDQTHKTTDHAQLIDGEWWAPCSEMFSMQRIVDNARAHSARWGRPAITPIPVSERLPGAEDCDAEGRCWWAWAVGQVWSFCSPPPYRATHWLPAHALPLPATPENADG